MTIYEFQEKYPEKWKREEIVKKMPDDEIDEIIESCDIVQGKIYYSKLKKENQIRRYSNRYNEITANVMRFFAGELNKNIVFSPFSIIMLLSIIADSVDGETRQQVLDVLGSDLPYEKFRDMIAEIQSRFTDEVIIRSGDEEYKTGGNVISSNVVCIQESIKKTITPGYEDRLAKYRGKLFASKDIVSDVNDWVKENTKGMIPKIADESLCNMLACLMNAIAFEAAWEDPFEEYYIKEDDFTNADKSISKVRMMQGAESDYIENDYFKGFVKPYRDTEFTFMALLPKKNSKSFLRRSLDSINFTKMLEETTDAEVHIKMPEFEYDFGQELTDFFQTMGIEKLFTTQADFSPMSSERMRMDGIIHKAHIEVDQNGTKAAAVSAGFVVTGAIPEIRERKTVYLTRPFIFAIVHEEMGLPVFVGIVNHVDEK